MIVRSFARKSAITFLAVIAMPVMLLAQAAPQDPQKADDTHPWKLSVGSNLVIVPVVVTDKHGDHVSGLSAEDFEVKEEGASQKIIGLEAVTGDTEKVEKAAAPATNRFSNTVVQRPKRLVIIALDQVNTPFENVNDSHRALIDFLSKSIDETTLVALVALQRNGVRIIHDFTNNPSVLVDAIKKVKASVTSRNTQTLDALGDNSQADLEAMQLTALLSGSSVSPGASVAELNAAAKMAPVVQRAQLDATRLAQDALITLEDFQQVAQYFWGVPGRKSLIWASTGFAFSTGATPQSGTRGTLMDDWQRTFRMLGDANISIYPVDVAGLLPGVNANNLQSLSSAVVKTGGPEGGVGARSQQLSAVESGALLDPTAGRHDTMRQMADMTGAQPLYNSNDVSGLLRQARVDASQYYMLAYYTKSTGKQGWRKLNVKVKRDNVKVRYRSGFFFRDPQNEADAARQADEMLALTSDLDFTAMPLSGAWGNVEPAANGSKVHFLLFIPAGITFIDSERQNHISLDFRAAALDSAGKVIASIGERLETNLAPENLVRVQSKGVDYANALTLPPGQYRVHFVVRDNLKGTLGSVVSPLKVE
jgi:VWFA-related protein